LVSSIFLILIINGRKIGTNKNVHSELAKINDRLRISPPFAWPSNMPIIKKANIAKADERQTKITNATGRSTKSPIVSRFTENR
jgi:hypothetical protein